MTTSKETPQISALLGGGVPAPSAVPVAREKSQQGAASQQNVQAGKKGSKRVKLESNGAASAAATETEKVSYLLPKDVVQNIRTLAWYQRKEIKQVVEDALRAYLNGPAAGALAKAVKEQEGRI